MNVINKVVYDDRVLIDLTADTVDPDRMYKGDTAHAADGTEITGTAEITVEGTTLVMPEGLCSLIGTVDPETHHWVRPDYLPDLDSVYNGELNTLYMTVDATGRISDPHVSIKVWCTSGNYTVQTGSIMNGAFVAETTQSVAHTGTWSKAWIPADNYYPVVKITADHLRATQLQAYTVNSHTYVAQYQAIVEWIGDFENADNQWRTPYFLEREKISTRGTSNASSLANRWQNAYCLQELDVSDWDTTNWNITSLAATWQYCMSLQYLDVSNWDVSKWKVTNMSNTWEYCFKLEGLDLTAWNVSGWAITNFNAPWSTCASLLYLDINNWDTSNWAVTSLNYTWYSCYSLKYLDVSNFNTSNWHVTSAMATTWNYCRSLISLDLSAWNTSNWAVTGSMSATWSNCISLEVLDVSTWDTSKWKITNLHQTWQYCYKLKYLDLSNWDVSGWTVTQLGYTWQSCYSLEELDVSTWNTSNWDVTALSNTWDNCTYLHSLDLSNWDVSGWVIPTINSTWNCCRHLKILRVDNWDTSKWTVTSMASTWNNDMDLEELDISSWDVSNWRVTTMATTFNWCLKLKHVDLSNWDTSDWPMTAVDCFAQTFRYMALADSLDFSCFDLSKITEWRSSNWNFEMNRMLQHVTFGANNNGKLTTSTRYPIIRFDWSLLLTRESILNIFNALADGVSGKTLQLGSANLNKLTAAEKAIATNKGWTLA